MASPLLHERPNYGKHDPAHNLSRRNGRGSSIPGSLTARWKFCRRFGGFFAGGPREQEIPKEKRRPKTPPLLKWVICSPGFWASPLPRPRLKKIQICPCRISMPPSRGNPTPSFPPLDATASPWMPAGSAGYPLPSGFTISDPGETSFLNSGEKDGGRIIPNNQDGGTNPLAFSVFHGAPGE